MAEYINRDAFLEQQRAWYCKDCCKRKNTRGKFVYEIGEAPCRACDIGTMLDAVEDYPAADVVERKIGSWRHYEGELTCSECAVTIYDDIMSLLGDDVPRFCPNCGAKMIGGDGDV